MTGTPWGEAVAAIRRLSDRMNAVPTFREATMASATTVLFDTDTVPTAIRGSLERDIPAGARVMTMTLRHYVWVLGVKGGVPLPPPPSPPSLAVSGYTDLPVLSAADAGRLMMTASNGRLYQWTGSRWAYRAGPSETIRYSEATDQTCPPGVTISRYGNNYVFSEPTMVRVTVSSGMVTGGNAAIDLQPWVNGYKGYDTPKRTIHSNGRAAIIPFTYVYEASLSPGTYQIGFGYQAHSGSSGNIATVGMQMAVERIPD